MKRPAKTAAEIAAELRFTASELIRLAAILEGKPVDPAREAVQDDPRGEADR